MGELLDTNTNPCSVFSNSGTNLLERATYSNMVVHINKQEEMDDLSMGLAVAMTAHMKVTEGVTTG